MTEVKFSQIPLPDVDISDRVEDITNPITLGGFPGTGAESCFCHAGGISPVSARAPTWLLSPQLSLIPVNRWRAMEATSSKWTKTGRLFVVEMNEQRTKALLLVDTVS